MPVQDYVKLAHLLRESEFVDASALLWKLRMARSPAKAAYIQKAAQILNRAYEAFFQERFEGRTERDAAAVLSAHIGRQGADRVGFISVNAMGMYTPSDRVLKRGKTFLVPGRCTRTTGLSSQEWRLWATRIRNSRRCISLLLMC
jgi:Xaa-Pro aminopeptidase